MANRLPVSKQRLPEILDGWHPPGGSRLETSSPEQTQGTPDWGARKLRLGPRRGKGAPHLGWVLHAREAPGCLSFSGREGTKRRPNWVRAFVEYPKTGTAHHAGPAPWRAAWSLSSVDGESTHLWAGPTQCGRNTASAPHTGQRHLSAGSLPPHSRTEQVNLNQRPPPPACVRAEIRRWRDRQTEAKETKGTTSSRDRCNRLNPCRWHRLHRRGLQILRSASWNQELPETGPNPHWPQQLWRNSSIFFHFFFN